MRVYVRTLFAMLLRLRALQCGRPIPFDVMLYSSFGVLEISDSESDAMSSRARCVGSRLPVCDHNDGVIAQLFINVSSLLVSMRLFPSSTHAGSTQGVVPNCV